MKTFASLFTGGGGADASARQLGYSHLWGAEYDPKIASVAELNGFSTIVADVCAVDFSTLAAPDWLHMSPPCTRASQANTNATESALDQALADACNRAIEVLQPRRVSLENVWGYRDFAAFRSILACLARSGYAVEYWHLNAANYGVPQTRKRLCLVASKDHTPRRPEPTHAKTPDPFDLFALLPWVGWHEAIVDLLSSLPDSAFAPWQLERLPEDLKTCLIGINNQNSPDRISIFPYNEPAFTITQQATRLRAFIIPGGNSGGPRDHSRPMHALVSSVSTQSNTRAYVGRVVKMTPRALARFNGLGDDYLLPASNTLACTVLGNMHILQGPMMEANP